MLGFVVLVAEGPPHTGSNLCSNLLKNVILWSNSVSCHPLGDLHDPGIEPVSHVSCSGRQVLYHQQHLGSPGTYVIYVLHLG